MERQEDVEEARDLLARMMDAIAAAETQTPWPAAELAELAEEVWADKRTPTVWALS